MVCQCCLFWIQFWYCHCDQVYCLVRWSFDQIFDYHLFRLYHWLNSMMLSFVPRVYYIHFAVVVQVVSVPILFLCALVSECEYQNLNLFLKFSSFTVDQSLLLCQRINNKNGLFYTYVTQATNDVSATFKDVIVQISHEIIFNRWYFFTKFWIDLQFVDAYNSFGQ